MSQSEADILKEISRLQGAIHRQTAVPSTSTAPVQYHSYRPRAQRGRGNSVYPSHQPHEVIIDGVKFQSSGKSLVRKPGSPAGSPHLHHLIKSPSASVSSTPLISPSSAAITSISRSPPPIAILPSDTVSPLQILGKEMIRTKKGSLVAANRIGKHSKALVAPRPPVGAMGKAHAPNKRGRGRYPMRGQRGIVRNKRLAVRIDKQCRHFTAKGVCNNGLKCPYNHDAAKVAICPRFMIDECPLSEESCPLSHNPTPERVPVCLHFANGGRCRNGNTCKYPHVRLGVREGVCRDFAVLGFCDQGIDCEHQHVKECPDFADSGTCSTKGCKLPHVIRAKHKRQDLPTPVVDRKINLDTSIATFEGNNEFISLMFDESSDEEESEESERSGSPDHDAEMKEV